MIAQHNTDYTNAGNAFDTTNGLPQMQTQIQGMKNTITGLQKTLSDLPQNVTARDKGTLTNAAQLSRQTTAEGIPITKNINDTTLALNPLETNYTNLETDKTNQLALLRDNQAREESGFTTDNQIKLNALLDKLTTQKTLDATETAQANAMALQASQYHADTSAKNTADVTSSAISDIQGGLKQWVGANKPSFWTEQTLIPKIQAAYPELSLSTIKNLVYTQRKNPEYGGE
jgi:hypothetical protein